MTIATSDMGQGTGNCQNCKTQFTIEPDDFGFYEKISVPPPTWCPECRQRRRYAWRNERVLYRRNCDLCGKSTVTIYSPNKPFKVYCPPCWWSDKWDAKEYGRDFDFSRPFFEQFRELQLQVPRIALLTKNSVGSEYTNHSGDDKNCYLCFGVFEGENCLYSTNMYAGATRDCLDCYHVTKGGELLYECVDAEQCYGCQFGYLLRGCSDCLYTFDCRGSSHCLFSFNLRNKQYHIWNKPYAKDAYHKELERLKLGSYAAREEHYRRWVDMIRAKGLHRFAVIENSANVSGNHLLNCRNTHYVFDGNVLEDVKYCHLTAEAKTSMDSYHFGLGSELIYESHGLVRGYNVRFTHLCYDDADIEYCDLCHNSEQLFGCVGIKKGARLIMNRQYGETEFRDMRDRIAAYMRTTGEYGEFFPISIAPVAYNETQGMIYMPMTKEEVRAQGWQWEDAIPGTFGRETLQPGEIPDDIKDVSDSILQAVLRCVSCKRNYNVVEPELQLYRRFSVPIPRHCPDCRYRRKIALRPPRKLWHRECMCDYERYANSTKHAHHPVGHCPNEFETSYAPERSEIVYCEACYQNEVI